MVGAEETPEARVGRGVAPCQGRRACHVQEGRIHHLLAGHDVRSSHPEYLQIDVARMDTLR